jgi:NHL repeat
MVVDPSSAQAAVGDVSTVAGLGALGPAGEMSFYRLSDVTTDRFGITYVLHFDWVEKIDSAGNVTRLAGSTSGFADGAGAQAQFNGAVSVVVDSTGNVFVADSGNRRIRKITPGGIVSTFAGSGQVGTADGIGVGATFTSPSALAIDPNNNLFLTEYGKHAVRKITPTGVVSTIAGSGSQGYVDGVGLAASFSYPRDIAADSSGVVYVSDIGNRRIRKIAVDGKVSTFAIMNSIDNTYGAYEGVVASQLSGIAVDQSGNVYFNDLGFIRKVAPGGVITTVAGQRLEGYVNGPPAVALFNNPTTLAVDRSGNVLVSDVWNNAVRKIEGEPPLNFNAISLVRPPIIRYVTTTTTTAPPWIVFAPIGVKVR